MRKKLTPAQVTKARRLYAAGNYTQGELAARYNVSRRCMGNALAADPACAMTARRKRGHRGEANPGAKIDEARAAEMRRLAGEGWSYPDIAARFGLRSVSHVGHVVRGGFWKPAPTAPS